MLFTRFFKFLSLTFFVLLTWCSCQRKEEQSTNSITKSTTEAVRDIPKNTSYISSFTPESISRKDAIYVVFKDSIAGWTPNKIVDASSFRITPQVKGTMKFINAKTIAFQPDELLKSDMDYTCRLDLTPYVSKKITSSERYFEFKVHTLKQQFSVHTEALQSYDKKWQYLRGTLSFSDVLDFESVKKLLTVTQENQPVKVVVEAPKEKFSKYFNFKIDRIERFDVTTHLKIDWSGEAVGIDSYGRRTIQVPSLKNFTVVKVDPPNADNKSIFIHFSDPLLKNQNFKGLVSLGHLKSLKYKVAGNSLKIYSTKILKGILPLKVYPGIQNIENDKLKNIVEKKISFDAPKPEIKLLQSGTFLPDSENLKINFKSINLKGVELEVVQIFENNVLQFLQTQNLSSKGNLQQVARPVLQKTILFNDNPSFNLDEWNAFAIDLKPLITPTPGAIYQVNIRAHKALSLYSCLNETPDVDLGKPLINYDKNIQLESSYWDDYDSSDSYYNWSQRNNPCYNSYYKDLKVTTNILASNLGVTLKKGINNSFKVAVSDLLTTLPIPEASVKFYNYQQQEIKEGTTDTKGIVHLQLDKVPYFVVVSHKKQKTYLKLIDGHALSMSTFDVSGSRLEKGLKGFIYAERAVWRPSDTLHLSFVLDDSAFKLPDSHPITFELRNPFGKVTATETVTKTSSNLYCFKFHTDVDDPTGTWQVVAKVGGAHFSKTVKIETIKPNRLKIQPRIGTHNPTDILEAALPITTKIEAQWLHGAVAKNLKTDMSVHYKSKPTSFKRYGDFHFEDPTKSLNSESTRIFNDELDQTGKATFTYTPKVDQSAPGLVRAFFTTKVHEDAGDFSTHVTSKTLSVYDTYVGLRTPKGDAARNMLLTDIDHRFDVVSVDCYGKSKANRKLKVEVYQLEWKWWWDSSKENLSSFHSDGYRNKVFNSNITTDENGRGFFNFKIEEPEWGRYLVLVTDKNSGHSTGKTVYIDWPGWAGRAQEDNTSSSATRLNFSSDKSKYQTGEVAKINFPSSEGARALVSIENGTEVLSMFWVETQEEYTQFDLPILKEYTPNIFVNISLIQPHGATVNDLPIRLYGVIPIDVVNDKTQLSPQLDMPNSLESEQTVAITVSEKDGKPMHYTLAIVDEGLLGLTNYKTPNPWDYFYQKEALGVKTWDMYDEVIGAYGGSINQVFKVGGDGMAKAGKSRKANRFKPVVIFKGPFFLDKNKSTTHQIKLPKYIGAVRTMLVASNSEDKAYGVIEKTATVTKPLMILGTAPRKLTPKEQVSIPVTVFTSNKNLKKVKVHLKSHEGFSIIGSTQKELLFSEPGEQMVFFDIEIAENAPDSTQLKITAEGNGKSTFLDIPLAITNPNPQSTAIEQVVLKAGEQKEVPVTSFGIKGSNSFALEASTLPNMNYQKRLDYLIRYPHGCVEQTTSSVFPQLYLKDITQLDNETLSTIQNHIEAGIKRLKRFIQPNGGLSYWPTTSTTANDWGTSYAGHFLLEAESKGYILPLNFKRDWIRYQEEQSSGGNHTNNSSSDLNKTYRLYTLALAGKPNISAMNRLLESAEYSLSAPAKLRLAATYALVGYKDVAEEIYNQVPNIEDSFNIGSDQSSYGSKVRNMAMALETVLLLDKKQEASKLAADLSDQLASKKWFSTQTTAYSLLALSKYLNYTKSKGLNFTYQLNESGEIAVVSSKSIAIGTPVVLSEGTSTLTLKNNNDQDLYLQLLSKGILPVGKEKTIHRGFKVDQSFKSKDGKLVAIDKLKQGTDFIAKVTLVNTSSEDVKDIALTQIFPSGWEIVNTRYMGSGRTSAADYTDIRDDKIHFYFDLKANKSISFEVLLNASYLGKYYYPGLQSEAMYDNDYFVRNKGQWVEVIR